MITPRTLKTRGGQGGVARIIGILFSLSCLILNYSPVHAETPTVTPIPTNTPTPLIGYCPSTTPLPQRLSLDYYSYCQACISEKTPTPAFGITPLALSTLSLNALTPGTPSPTGGTPTPSQTPTITPTPSPTAFYNFTIFSKLTSVGGSSPQFTNYQMPDNEVQAPLLNYSSYGTKENVYYLANGSDPAGYKVYYEFISYSYGGSYMYGVQTYVSIWNNFSQTISVTFRPDSYVYPGQTKTIPANSTAYYYWTNNSSWGAFDDRGKAHIAFDLTLPASWNSTATDVTIKTYMGDVGNSGSRTFLMASRIIRGGYVNPTPTPQPATPTITPTGNVPSWCGSYDYQDTSKGIVGWGAVTISQGACIKFVPEINLDLPAVGELIPAIGFTSPGISLCPKYVDLGTFTVAGTEIPTDLLALPAVVFLLWVILSL